MAGKPRLLDAYNRLTNHTILVAPHLHPHVLDSIAERNFPMTSDQALMALRYRYGRVLS